MYSNTADRSSSREGQVRRLRSSFVRGEERLGDGVVVGAGKGPTSPEFAAAITQRVVAGDVGGARKQQTCR